MHGPAGPAVGGNGAVVIAPPPPRAGLAGGGLRRVVGRHGAWNGAVGAANCNREGQRGSIPGHSRAPASGNCPALCLNGPLLGWRQFGRREKRGRTKEKEATRLQVAAGVSPFRHHNHCRPSACYLCCGGSIPPLCRRGQHAASLLPCPSPCWHHCHEVGVDKQTPPQTMIRRRVL